MTKKKRASPMTDDIPVDTPLGKTVGAIEKRLSLWYSGGETRTTILALCAALREAHAGLVRKNEDGAAAYEWGSDAAKQLREAREEIETWRREMAAVTDAARTVVPDREMPIESLGENRAVETLMHLREENERLRRSENAALTDQLNRIRRRDLMIRALREDNKRLRDIVDDISEKP